MQVTIYREGRPDDLLRFDDKGSLVRQAYRPVFEAAVTYEPATGGIEVIANDKATRSEIVKATVMHLRIGIASASSGATSSSRWRTWSIMKMVLPSPLKS